MKKNIKEEEGEEEEKQEQQQQEELIELFGNDAEYNNDL